MRKRITFSIIFLSVFLTSCSSLRILWKDTDNKENNIACFTFDDGPNEVSTEKVLSVLEKYSVPATFFLIGENVERNKELTKKIFEKGFSIGNHSYYHDTFLFMKNEKEIENEIIKTNKLINEITGFTPTLFRPPNAVINDTIEKSAKNLAMIPTGVNVFINDPMKTNPEQIYSEVMKSMKTGANTIVLHDGFGTISGMNRSFIAVALEEIIKKLKRKHYNFGKINEFGKCAL